MKKPVPNYNKEFKEQAVDLLLSSGRPLRQVALELGITAASLRNWRNRRLLEGNGRKESTQLKDPAVDLRRLQREVEYLRRQRDILKKAVSILSEEPANGMR